MSLTTKNHENIFDNQKIENEFLFLKTIYIYIFKEQILVVFTCFLIIVLKNNHTNVKTDEK